MFIRYRPIRLTDLPECTHSILNSFFYTDEMSEHLIRMWCELLTQGAANAAVMEDVSAPPGQRIVWFCSKVFITDEYVEYLKTDAAPLVGRQILEGWLKGMAPVMNKAEVREANSGAGVNLLVLNSGAPAHVLAGEKWTVVADKVSEFIQYFCAGYRLKHILIESYDDFTCAWAEGAGLRLQTDYARYYAIRSLTPPPADWYPRLYGATTQEAAARIGTVASTVFCYHQPRFFFKPIQQDLLMCAMLGGTDEELSATLGVALITVRKRWETIYEHVYERESSLFSLLRSSKQAGRRGPEKKRHLLNYLSHHLEELRPLNNPRP